MSFVGQNRASLQVKTMVETVIYCALSNYERKLYLPCEVGAKASNESVAKLNSKECVQYCHILRFLKNNLRNSFKDQYVVLMGTLS